MYFPYLRGKQYEVLAVRESVFLSSNRIIPVFEPTNLSVETRNRFRDIANKGVKFSVIVNSVSGKPPPELAATIRVLKDLESHVPGAVLPAFEIRAGRPVSDVEKFAKKFSSQQCILVHRNHTHSKTEFRKALSPLSRPAVQILLDGGASLDVVKSLPAVGRVLLRDGFNRCAPNADYPKRSNFDDLLYTYGSREFDGFSDFSIVGDVYSPGGGPAKHVAIHLTELEKPLSWRITLSLGPHHREVTTRRSTSALLGSWCPIQGLHPVPISILREYASITNPTLRNTIPASEN